MLDDLIIYYAIKILTGEIKIEHNEKDDIILKDFYDEEVKKLWKSKK